jgi:hypothetical protein
MPEIDFVTAFGQLLCDGALRDDFARQPEMVAERLNLAESERPAFTRLIPEEVELQAQVLLRKRLDIVRRVIPETCRQLQGSEVTTFFRYARRCWPREDEPAGRDALGFCRHLRCSNPKSLSEEEWHRLEFAFSSRRVSIHRLVKSANHRRTSFQLFLALPKGHWREFHVRLGL